MALIPDVINYLIGVSAVSAITTRIYLSKPRRPPPIPM
jgi:hypothetical protein